MPTETQAWVVHEKGGPFVLEEVTLDDPLEDEVLVKMTSTGVCHTDATMGKGLLPGAIYPIILGHEGAGKVVAVGSKVTSIQAGDSVLLSFAHCNTCEKCKEEAHYACSQFGALNFGKVRSNGNSEVGTLKSGVRVHGSFFGQSSFGRHALVRETSCVRVADGLDLRLYAPLGCGMQTGAGAVINVAKPSPNSRVLVSGMGGVGMAALFALVAAGVRQIIVVDTFDDRLELARSFGATYTINARTASVADEVPAATDGHGVDYAIECTGVAAAAKGSFAALALGGTQIQIGDNGVGELSVPLSWFLQGLRSIVGCVEGNCSPRKLIPQLVDLHKQGKFPLERISQFYSWRDLAQVEIDVHSGKTIKPILVYDE